MHTFVSVSTLSMLLLLAACSSETKSAGGGGPLTLPDSGSGSGPPACADFGGTCVKGSTTNTSPTCAAGMARIVEGDGCTGSFDVCCVPERKAGSKELRGEYGLLCTDKAFAEFGAGSCSDGGKAEALSCNVGCTCSATGCDCGRGLPPTKPGQVDCAVFGCGSITCGPGCTCADPKTGACRCG